MKAAGAICIIAAGLALVLELRAGRRALIGELRDTLAMLNMMGAELEISRAPIPGILKSILPRANGRAAVFIKTVCLKKELLGEKSLGEIWNESAASAFRRLGENELSALCGLGAVLGRYSIETQLAEINRCAGVFRGSLEKAGDEAAEKNRYSAGIILAACAFLLIVLI